MIHRTTNSPLTVGRLLFDGPDPAVGRALKRSLEQAGVYGAASKAVGALSGVGREEVRLRLTEAAEEMLGGRVVDTLATGWGKQGELVSAAEETVDDPGRTALVELCSHRITANHECGFDLLVDGGTVAAFRFLVTLVFDIGTMLAVVRGGRLVELRGGSCGVLAALAVNGREVASQRRQIELSRTLTLAGGLPLCRPTGARPDSRQGSLAG